MGSTRTKAIAQELARKADRGDPDAYLTLHLRECRAISEHKPARALEKSAAA